MARATIYYRNDFNPPWAKQVQQAAKPRRRQRADTAPLPRAVDWKALADMLGGKGLPFDVALLVVQEDGSVAPAVKRFYIRQPTTVEYDDAMMLYDQTEMAYKASALAAGLKGQPLEGIEELAAAATDPKEAARLRALTADVYLARMDATLRRDRWLTVRLLCDENGKPVCDTETPEGIAQWDALPLAVKNAARPVIQQMLEVVNKLPFGWARLKDFASVPANASVRRPTT